MVVFSIVILVFPWVASEIPKHNAGRDESGDSFSQGFEKAQIFSETNFPPHVAFIGSTWGMKNGTVDFQFRQKAKHPTEMSRVLSTWIKFTPI